MKRAIIVHCWGGSPDYAWYPWTKTKLEELGYRVTVPSMPNTEEPKLAEWLPTLQSLVGQPNEELLLVGHSLGAVTIMRYLESLPDDQTIGKAVFVAGFTDQVGFKELDNFFDTALDFDKIKPKSKAGFVAIQSDDDPFVSEQQGTILQQELGAKLIIKHGAKHMSGPSDGELACTELPELLEAINNA